MNSIFLTVIVIIFILTLFYFTSKQSDVYSESLTGFYNSSTEFLELAGIDGMYFYIGEPLDGGTRTTEKRKAYFIMHDQGSIIADKKIIMTLTKPSQTLLQPMQKEIKYTVMVEDEEESSAMEDETESFIPLNKIMPTDLELFHDITMNRVSLKGIDEDNNEKLYAELFKSPHK